MKMPKNYDEFKFWLLSQLPMWDYICPKCNQTIDRQIRLCPYCHEIIAVAVRVPPKVLKNKKALSEYIHKNIMPFLKPCELAYIARYFTIIFQDGFESGNFNAWDGFTGGPNHATDWSVQGTIIHDGSYAAMCTRNAADRWGGYYSLLGGGYFTELYFRIYFRFDTWINVNTSMTFQYITSKPPVLDIIGAGIRNIGGVRYLWVRRYYPADQSFQYAFNWQLNRWYCVELHFKKNATQGEYHVWIDGILYHSETGLNTSGAPDAGRASFVQSVSVFASYPAHSYLDCCIVADTYIGPEVKFAGGASIVPAAKALLGGM